MSRRLVAAVAATAFLCAAGAAVAANRLAPRANAAATHWSVGTGSAVLSRAHLSSDLVGHADDATFQGDSIAEQGADGNFEFEHGADVPTTTLDARTAAGAPTSLRIGSSDGQNVTALTVPAPSGMTDDIQSWQVGTKAPTAIDRLGRLRLNGIVIVTTTRNGRTILAAVLPDGSVQVLVPVAEG